jgi:hypothetical protein
MRRIAHGFVTKPSMNSGPAGRSRPANLRLVSRHVRGIEGPMKTWVWVVIGIAIALAVIAVVLAVVLPRLRERNVQRRRQLAEAQLAASQRIKPKLSPPKRRPTCKLPGAPGAGRSRATARRSKSRGGREAGRSREKASGSRALAGSGIRARPGPRWRSGAKRGCRGHRAGCISAAAASELTPLRKQRP